MRMWLGDSRGHAVDWATQRWVQLTGRRIALKDHPWLDGPTGPPAGIGVEFFDHYATANRLRLDPSGDGGLIPDMHLLGGTECDISSIAPLVVDFYQRTSAYDVDAWSEWCGFFRPFGAALALIFSRRLQQLNVPLSGLDTSRGMTSTVLAMTNAAGAQHLFTAWVRTLRSSGDVIYAGAYSICEVPGHRGRCVRVVFPLPNGNAIVIMRPVVNANGSLTLVSAGEGFGSPGFYFTVRCRDGVVWARYLRAMRETIHVFAAEDGVRADHVLKLFGITFLRLHYRLRRRAP